MRRNYKHTTAHFSTVARSRRAVSSSVVMQKTTFVDLDEQLEDTKLNAIADERADGPFVKVSLDDL